MSGTVPPGASLNLDERGPAELPCWPPGGMPLATADEAEPALGRF
jgi:hypothetical protein